MKRSWSGWFDGHLRGHISRVTKIIKKDTGHDARHTHSHTLSLFLSLSDKKSLSQAWSMFWSLSVHLLQWNTLFQNYISGRARAAEEIEHFLFLQNFGTSNRGAVATKFMVSPPLYRCTSLYAVFICDFEFMQIKYMYSLRLIFCSLIINGMFCHKFFWDLHLSP